MQFLQTLLWVYKRQLLVKFVYGVTKILNIIWLAIQDSRFLKKNFMAPFYGWGSTDSRLVPLRGGSLLFITKFPDILGTHFIDLERMKG